MVTIRVAREVHVTPKSKQGEHNKYGQLLQCGWKRRVQRELCNVAERFFHPPSPVKLPPLPPSSLTAPGYLISGSGEEEALQRNGVSHTITCQFADMFHDVRKIRWGQNSVVSLGSWKRTMSFPVILLYCQYKCIFAIYLHICYIFSVYTLLHEINVVH